LEENREKTSPDDDPMPPKPGLGAGGPRPDWLVSAEDGLSAEAGKRTKADMPRPPVLKVGGPKPASAPTPETPPAPTDVRSGAFKMPTAGGGSAFQMPAAGGDAIPGVAPPMPEVGAAIPAARANPISIPTPERAAPNPAASAGTFDDGAGAGGFRPVSRPSDAPAVPAWQAAATAPALDEAADANVPWVEPAAAPARKKKVTFAVVPDEGGLDPPASKPATQWLEHPAVKIGAVVAGLLIVALVVLHFIPRDGGGSAGTRIAEIRKAPKAFDGRLVTVTGRVGDIFTIGPSFAYYLHDGNETLLVFTRGDAPESTKKHTVTGTISTGFLDGKARLSLFERQ